MAVPRLINLFEALERPSTPPQERGRMPSRIRLQLETIFSHSRSRQASPRTSTPSSSIQSSPSPSYRSYRQRTRPYSDLTCLFTPIFTASSPSSFAAANARRQPSSIDMALEAERYATEAENIGLGLLEPRPRATSSSSAGSRCSIMEFMNESQPAPLVLDGIFEVMESALA